MSIFDLSSFKKSGNVGVQVNTLPLFTLDADSVRYDSYYLSASGSFSLDSSTLRMSYTVYGDFDWNDDSLERQRISSIYYNYGSRLGSISIRGLEGITVQSIAGDPNLAINSMLIGNDIITGTNYNDNFMSHSGADQIYGGGGDDEIHGASGSDIVDGGIGNDNLRGGNGHDEIRGGTGLDFLWGGLGSNVLSAGIDSVKDDLYVPVDSVVNPAGNPGGANRDFLTEVTSVDRIYMHGIDDAALTYAAGVLDPRGSGLSGVGIYANGILEAIVHDSSGLSASQVNDITTGGVFA